MNNAENNTTHTATENTRTWDDMTPLEYDLSMCIWDDYKSLYGVRPRHIDFPAMTLEELEDLSNFLRGCLTEERTEEEAEITRVCNEYGVSREDLIRWEKEEDNRWLEEHYEELDEEFLSDREYVFDSLEKSA
jgi:hypothetical protein